MARGLRRIRVDNVLSSGSQGPAQMEMLPLPGDIAESPAISGARRLLVYAKASWDINIWRVDLGGGTQRGIAATKQ